MLPKRKKLELNDEKRNVEVRGGEAFLEGGDTLHKII